MLGLPQKTRKSWGQTLFCIEMRCSVPPVPGTEEDNTPSHGLLRCRELIQENALTASMDVLVPNRNEIRFELSWPRLGASASLVQQERRCGRPGQPPPAMMQGKLS